MRFNQESGLKIIPVEKKRLIEALTANREAHQKAYNEAVIDYWKALNKQVPALIKPIGDQAFGNFAKQLDVINKITFPENHAPDYDRALQMLDWSVDDEVMISEHEFCQYIQDDWSWKRGTASNYAMLKRMSG